MTHGWEPHEGLIMESGSRGPSLGLQYRSSDSNATTLCFNTPLSPWCQPPQVQPGLQERQGSSPAVRPWVA